MSGRKSQTLDCIQLFAPKELVSFSPLWEHWRGLHTLDPQGATENKRNLGGLLLLQRIYGTARWPPPQHRKRKVKHLTYNLAFHRRLLEGQVFVLPDLVHWWDPEYSEAWILLRTIESWVASGSFREPAELHQDTRGSKRLWAPEERPLQSPLTGSL